MLRDLCLFTISIVASNEEDKLSNFSSVENLLDGPIMFIPKYLKFELILLMSFIFLLLKPLSLSAEWISIHFDADKQKLTVNIKQASLKRVIGKIKSESRIWVDGEGYLANERISVEFKDLSFEEGMKRLLKNMNHSLVFDSNGDLLGVSIIGTKERKSSRTYNRRRRPRYRRR